MSDCLHCEIVEMVQQRIDGGETDLANMAALIAESLAEVILLAPEEERSALMANAIAHLGDSFLEKRNAMEEGTSAAKH